MISKSVEETIGIGIKLAKSLKKGDVVVGNRVRVKVVKNKVAAPFRQAEFDILFDEGISRSSNVVELGTLYQVIDKSGTWLAFNDQKLGQGKDAARIFLKENEKLLKEIEGKILEKVAAGETALVGATAE